jgi:hypothetical protein
MFRATAELEVIWLHNIQLSSRSSHLSSRYSLSRPFHCVLGDADTFACAGAWWEAK